MTNVTDFPKQSEPEELLVGPFEYYQVVVEGRAIPRLTGHRMGPDHTSLIVDRRFAIDVPNGLARQVAWLVANALAVGEGFSHLAATDKAAQPFAPSMVSLTKDPPPR